MTSPPPNSPSRREGPALALACGYPHPASCDCPASPYIITRQMRVVATRAYDRRAARLLSKEARAAAEAAIIARPDAWPVIRGTGGARKARIALPGRGKRGGARIIYFVHVQGTVIYLLEIYAKGEKEDLTDAEKRAIRERIKVLEAGT